MHITYVPTLGLNDKILKLWNMSVTDVPFFLEVLLYLKLMITIHNETIKIHIYKI